MRQKTTRVQPPAPIIVQPMLAIASASFQPHMSIASFTQMVSSRTKLQRKEK